ncbi:MAG: prpB [Armatimonadetes bacterium]|nr:prpB [Armatimonadota bacterium]
MATSARRLRELLLQPGLIPSLAPHDVFTALIMEQVGLPLLFAGGFGVAASTLGLPDLNFPTLTEMAEAVRRMTGRLTVPLIADGDTGHGDLIHVQRTVREFERAGAAGMLLEDQAAPKRCGHFEGKALVSPEEMVLRLRAALDARSDPDFVIIARTDARAVEGLDAAIARMQRYRETGADVAFIEAPESAEELARIPREIPGPHLANMLTGGKTPILPLPELEALGYKIAVAPIESLSVTARAVQLLARDWLEQGRVDHLVPDRMAPFSEVKELLGLERYLSVRDGLAHHVDTETRRKEGEGEILTG